MTWYMIFRTWRVNDSLRLEEIDAVQCDCMKDALAYAKRRYSTKGDEIIRVEACSRAEHIKRAQSLHNQHALDDQVTNWTPKDLLEFFSAGIYAGDQDKYTIQPRKGNDASK